MSCAASSTRWAPQDAIEFLIDKLRQSKNNGDFFQSMNT
jgi:transcription termination factor Rho